MIFFKGTKRFLLAGFFSSLVLFAASAAADELTVGAQVDKTQVSAGQLLTFSITIAGPIRQTPKVQINSFEGFQVVSTGQSQQIQVQAGQSRQALVLTYALAPTVPGTHVLGPVKVEYKGHTYETQPIEIKVVEGPAQKEETLPESDSTEDWKTGEGIIL